MLISTIGYIVPARRPLAGRPCEPAVGSTYSIVHGDSAATTRTHDNLGLVLVEVSLSDANGQNEVIVIERRADDFVSALVMPAVVE